MSNSRLGKLVDSRNEVSSWKIAHFPRCHFRGENVLILLLFSWNHFENIKEVTALYEYVVSVSNGEEMEEG